MKKIIDFGQFLNKLNESFQDSDLVGKIDYTLLAPSATEDDIVELCEKAKVLGVKSVCVLPKMVRVAAEVLEDSDVLVCTVVSFPHGTDTTEQKLAETKECIANGADEIDMVLNYPELKNEGSYNDLVYDVKTLADECHKKRKILKVIVESSELSSKETEIATHICLDAGADFIKTSTGMMTPSGKAGFAELDKVEIMRDIITEEGSDMQIKASGAIRTMADLQKFAPYVDRFGVGYAAVDTIFGGAKAGDNLY
jgi:deoxyribose-phosphate aldolase